MKKFKILIIMTISLVLSIPVFAGEKNISGKVGIGAYIQGDNDELDRAAEYKEDDSSPAGNVELKAFNSTSDIYVEGNYEGESTNDLKIKGNLLRHLDVDFSYNRLYHRKSYDKLFIDFDKNNFTFSKLGIEKTVLNLASVLLI